MTPSKGPDGDVDGRDDLKTGCSSLSYLQSLPIHEPKIDRCYVMSVERLENAAIIIRSIINLGRSLGFAMVAEGVESQKSYDALRDLGCEQVQGHLIGRPMPPEALNEWLRKGPWKSAAFARASRARTGAGCHRQASPTWFTHSPGSGRDCPVRAVPPVRPTGT